LRGTCHELFGVGFQHLRSEAIDRIVRTKRQRRFARIFNRCMDNPNLRTVNPLAAENTVSRALDAPAIRHHQECQPSMMFRVALVIDPDMA
jgi:hypothetical protein